MTANEAMMRINEVLSHAWMVRAFLKHADEIQEDQEMLDVHRTIYDYMRAVEPSLKRGDSHEYLRRARGKLSKLAQAAAVLSTEYRRVSDHTNFEMAALSLSTCVREIGHVLAMVAPSSSESNG